MNPISSPRTFLAMGAMVFGLFVAGQGAMNKMAVAAAPDEAPVVSASVETVKADTQWAAGFPKHAAAFTVNKAASVPDLLAAGAPMSEVEANILIGAASSVEADGWDRLSASAVSASAAESKASPQPKSVVLASATDPSPESTLAAPVHKRVAPEVSRLDPRWQQSHIKHAKGPAQAKLHPAQGMPSLVTQNAPAALSGMDALRAPMAMTATTVVSSDAAATADTGTNTWPDPFGAVADTAATNDGATPAQMLAAAPVDPETVAAWQKAFDSAASDPSSAPVMDGVPATLTASLVVVPTSTVTDPTSPGLGSFKSAYTPPNIDLKTLWQALEDNRSPATSVDADGVDHGELPMMESRMGEPPVDTQVSEPSDPTSAQPFKTKAKDNASPSSPSSPKQRIRAMASYEPDPLEQFASMGSLITRDSAKTQDAGVPDPQTFAPIDNPEAFASPAPVQGRKAFVGLNLKALGVGASKIWDTAHVKMPTLPDLTVQAADPGPADPTSAPWPSTPRRPRMG